MKKIILSIVMIAGIITLTNVSDAIAVEQPSIMITQEDDGFVDVKLEDLNEQVQSSINALAEEYDLQAIKYNEEKQLTKVKLLKKDDQSAKTLFFDVAGKEVKQENVEQENVEQENVEQEKRNEIELNELEEETRSPKR